MRKFDLIVIGSGLAGLMSATVAARHGQKVLILTYGSGSLPLSSGAIDFFGKTKFPRVSIENLGNHIYNKIGLENILNATDFFIDITKKSNLKYVGDLSKQIPIITALGTIKYSCLVPESMDATKLFKSHQILVIGIKGLKDFYPSLVVENLEKCFKDIKFEETTIDLDLIGGRDITSVDVAQSLTNNKKIFIDELAKLNLSKYSALVVPPVLGIEEDHIFNDIKNSLGIEIFETTCLPPSPPGIRLQKIFMNVLQDFEVSFFENSKVIQGIIENDNIIGVVVEGAARSKKFYGSKFILATGGFYGGGISMRNFDKPEETIFNLPVSFLKNESRWSNEKLFSDIPQGFAMTGIMVNEKLNPISKTGKVIFDNVHIVGGNLGGCDAIFEHSAGGIALASAYKAAMIQGRCENE